VYHFTIIFKYHLQYYFILHTIYVITCGKSCRKLTLDWNGMNNKQSVG